MRCAGQRGTVEMHGEATYTGDAFEGQMTMKTADPRSGRQMEMKSTMHGKRVGACE